MSLLQMYPVMIPYNSAPLTKESATLMVGIFIVLNIIWVITLIVASLLYWRNLDRPSIEEYFFADNILLGLLNVVMLVCWGFILLSVAGLWVVNYLKL